MTIAHDARRIVEQALEAAVDIVDTKLHSLKIKNEKEFTATTDRIVAVARMIVDARLHLEQMMMVDGDEVRKEEEKEEPGDDDPDLFVGSGTRVA